MQEYEEGEEEELRNIYHRGSSCGDQPRSGFLRLQLAARLAAHRATLSAAHGQTMRQIDLKSLESLQQ